MIEKIKDLLKILSAKERDVLILLFGISRDGHCRPAEEIAQLYGVDKDTIVEIAQQALSKLPVSAEEFKVMCEKVSEELKDKASEKEFFGDLNDIDEELLNINFPESSWETLNCVQK